MGYELFDDDLIFNAGNHLDDPAIPFAVSISIMTVRPHPKQTLRYLDLERHSWIRER